MGFVGGGMMVTRRDFLVAVGLIATPGARGAIAAGIQKSKPKLATVTLTIDGMT